MLQENSSIFHRASSICEPRVPSHPCLVLFYQAAPCEAALCFVLKICVLSPTLSESCGDLFSQCGASPEFRQEQRSCVLPACPGSFFSSVYLAAPRGFVCSAPASVGHSLRMCFSPKHKHLLPGVVIRLKPSEPQQVPISLSHSCGDDSLTLNDVCFQFRD